MAGTQPSAVSPNDVILLPGELNRRITIQVPSDTPDGQRGKRRTWIDAVTVWASIETSLGGEAYQFDQQYPSVTYRITVRYSPTQNYSAVQRVKYGNKILEVKSVINLKEANVAVDLLCEELQSPGSTHA